MAGAKTSMLSNICLFQTSWTNKYAFLSQKDRAVCALCCGDVSNFLTRHEKNIKHKADEAESNQESSGQGEANHPHCGLAREGFSEEFQSTFDFNISIHIYGTTRYSHI